MTIAEYGMQGKFKELLHKCRESRKLVLIIVAIALLLDNMLLTTVGKDTYVLCILQTKPSLKWII